MNEYQKDIEKYLELLREEYAQINEYNSKVCSYGYASYFAMVAFTKGTVNEKLFITSIIFMTISIFLFVMHEVIRMLYLSRSTSSRQKALEKIPDRNYLHELNDLDQIAQLRFHKFSMYLFWPTLITAILSTAIIFYSYIETLIG